MSEFSKLLDMANEKEKELAHIKKELDEFKMEKCKKDSVSLYDQLKRLHQLKDLLMIRLFKKKISYESLAKVTLLTRA